jgi:hemerythrin superfamily protein
MSDDRNERGSQDRSRIALDEPHEVRYWTRKLGVSEDALAQAVHAVGPSSEKVTAYLELQREEESTGALPKLFRSAVSAITGGVDEDAVTLLERDHREIDALFDRFDELSEDGSAAERARVVEEICAVLAVHAAIEEEIFYPAVRRHVKDVRDLVDEAVVEHGTLKDLIARLERMQPADDLYKANVTVLKEYVQHHVKEEERELFKKVKASDLELERLGEALEQRKLELLTAVASPGIGGTLLRAAPQRARRGNSARSH